jgi:hypothetical protein
VFNRRDRHDHPLDWALRSAKKSWRNIKFSLSLSLPYKKKKKMDANFFFKSTINQKLLNVISLSTFPSSLRMMMMCLLNSLGCKKRRIFGTAVRVFERDKIKE